MRIRLYRLSFILLVALFSTGVWSQCTPGDGITCPDPENNGQVCPDSLQAAFAGRLYSQSFTILAPPVYVTPESDTIQLHHITLVELANLPPGFTWQSNSVTNEFMIGTYYCVLMEGTPAVAGKYPLHITVGVYVKPFPTLPPILVATVTDSTSLFLEVKWDPNGLNTPSEKPLTILGPNPNPFSGSTLIGIHTDTPGMINLHIYDLVGQLRYTELLPTRQGDNYFAFDGRSMTRGMYFLKISTGNFATAVRLIKIE
ncbi:MAG: T9SS type A sorting domain-containing protein [Bacteroidales bacterium]|nr:T9SS type A sorting domain-containing protein [Lentimicrobiaceae bacterium]MDD5695568.1 T9SS type A sorting domain-containing protein [Bacteroidales bacterium]